MAFPVVYYPKYIDENTWLHTEDFPAHMNTLGRFVYYRTYSRYNEKYKRRETWKETVTRAVEYNIGLAEKHFKKLGYPVPYDELKRDGTLLFTNMYNLKQFLSGRTLWIGGAESGVAEKYPLGNFNCSFVEIKSFNDFQDLFYLLMVGTGVGFRVTKENAKSLPPLRRNVKVIHKPYSPVARESRQERTTVKVDGNKAILTIGDSKEGWAESLQMFLQLLSDEKYVNVHIIKIVYDNVRPKGERLKTFGGTASGPEPLQEMYEGIMLMLHGKIDRYTKAPDVIQRDEYGNEWVQLRPVHCLDIGNLIGANVVVGGVRRTAEIYLFDADDYESMFAKYGINGVWDEEKHKRVISLMRKNGLDEYADLFEGMPIGDPNARPVHHRRLSNNSIVFESKPAQEFLELVFAVMQAEGEPGFVNLEAASKRRPNVRGLNPCAEILLDSYGVCNLTTVNVLAFVRPVYGKEGKYTLDIAGLLNAQRASVRAGLRMTLADLELPHWDAVQKRDRLLGCSLTGWQDAMDLLEPENREAFEETVLSMLRSAAHDEAEKYSAFLRVPRPLLVTTVKPEGTLSQVAGGVSSGLHASHAPYYIRRIRVNADDPMAKVAKALGWTIHAEVGTDGKIMPEDLAKPEVIAKAKTLVIDFPVKSGAKRTKNDLTVQEQFATYFRFQTFYTDHNSSNTITVKPDEWDDALAIVWNKWDDYVAVSFLAHDGGTYTLAPYEEITKEQYEAMADKYANIDANIVAQFDNAQEFDLDGMDGCEGGACPIR